MHKINCYSSSIVFAVISWIAPSQVSGHDVPVHRVVTRQAVENSYTLANFLNSVFPQAYQSSVDLNFPKFSFLGKPFGPKGWIVEGSEREDDIKIDDLGNPDQGGNRPLNHFYDPISGMGLSDIQAISDLPDQVVGDPSFKWASTLNDQSNHGAIAGYSPILQMTNVWSWQNARDYEYKALTGSTTDIRNSYFAQTFRAIGQVMHLLEDTSQPEHVRNDQHLYGTVYQSVIEDYGRDHLSNLKPYITGGPMPCQKLEDLWDTHQLSKYGAGALSTNAQMGLAEYTNGNFLGRKSLYGELYEQNALHWYKYPSLNTSTNFSEVYRSPEVGFSLEFDPDGIARNHIYIEKNGDGIAVTHHSIVSYLGIKNRSRINKIGFSIRDNAVLEEYHEMLLPQAVSYAAGCLDYFFRGSIRATIGYDDKQGSLAISGTCDATYSMNGGKFELYWDDDNGTRSKLTEFSASGSFTDIAIPAPQGTIKSRNCVLVYKGSVTSQNASDDPVDEGIAIAACSVYMPYLPQIVNRHQTVAVIISGMQNLTGYANTYLQQLNVLPINADHTVQHPTCAVGYAFYQEDPPVQLVGVALGISNYPVPARTELGLYCYDTYVPNSVYTVTGYVVVETDYLDFPSPFDGFYGIFYNDDQSLGPLETPIDNQHLDDQNAYNNFQLWGYGGTCLIDLDVNQ